MTRALPSDARLGRRGPQPRSVLRLAISCVALLVALCAVTTPAALARTKTEPAASGEKKAETGTDERADAEEKK